MLDMDLRQFAGLFDAYTELRIQENRNKEVKLVNGSVATNSRSAMSGVSARVNRNGSWGFASNPNMEEGSIRSVIKTASNNAALLDSKERKGRPPLPWTKVSSENDFSTKEPRLTQKQLVEFLREIDAHIVGTCPNLSSRIVRLLCLDMEKTLFTSDGSFGRSMIPRSIIRVTLTLEKEGDPIELTSVFGGLGQFEDVLVSPDSVFEGIGTLYQQLVQKSEGGFAKAGTRTCVLDADLAGILAHEAIGHSTEADLVMGGSAAGPLLNKEAASPLITLVDFANTAQSEICPVPVYVDDEGTEARDAIIIDKGILKGYMHNKESAARFGVSPAGNARAYQFSDEPLIRMRNTVIMPGTSRFEDMIASVDDGYYLMKPNNGQADMTGEFMFGITLGYEIKDGKMGKAIRDTTISGVAFDLLKSVTMVSRDMKWTRASMCGKKQIIPVGMGGPAIKCRVNIGGR